MSTQAPDEGFNPQIVEDLITAALSERVSPERTRSSKDVLFTFGDTRLLECLHGILVDYMEPQNIALVLDALRQRLVEGTSPQDIRWLHRIIANRLGENVRLALGNLVDPDIMFLSEYPLRGNDDEQTMVEAMHGVDFDSKNSCWNFIVKTSASIDESELEQELDRYMRYVHAEIRLWRPKLIVPIGSKATSLLLNTGGITAKFSDSCGTIFWAGPWAIMPTFSPSYAAHAKKFDVVSEHLQHAYRFCYGS